MVDLLITKRFVRLIEDHVYEEPCLYPEENCFLPAGTEGVVIDEHTIGLIPNISDQKYSEIVRRDIMAKKWGASLVLIDGRIVTICSGNLEFVRYDPPLPIFEDDADWEQYVDEKFEEIRKLCSEANKNASP